MNENQKVREAVAKSYARAVSSGNSAAGCCSRSASCCGPQAQQSEVSRLAGYDQKELALLPPDAVVNSFGCGNPVAFSGIEAGDVVLDLGSGAGIDVLIAARKVGPTGRVIGVDMTDEMLAKARENIATSEIENAEVRKGTIEQLPVESSTVDWVISNCVINLSPEKTQVFSEIARVLKPGGQMLVSDIVVEELPGWARANDALYNSCVGGAISEVEYVNGLRLAGLVDVEVRDRISYEPSQLEAMFHSDLAMGDQTLEQWTKSLDGRAVREMTESLAGRIWSAMVYARKPDSMCDDDGEPWRT